MKKKLLCALLAALLLTCIGACAETAEGPDLDLINPDLILAQDTVDYLELTAPEGITVNYDDENENTNLTIFGQSAGTGRLTIEKPTTVRRTPL